MTRDEMKNKYYTKKGEERKPTLHEIICIEADVEDCEEADRICTLIKARIREKGLSEEEIETELMRIVGYMAPYIDKKVIGLPKAVRDTAKAIKSEMDKAVEKI